MTSHTLARGLAAGVVVALGLGTLAGCSSSSAEHLRESQDILATCPKDQPLNSLVQIDGSGSMPAVTLSPELTGLLEDVVQRTAVCGGHLTISSFSSGSGATALIYDSDLTLTAPTENARLRRVPRVVEAVMEDVARAYESAVASLPSGGSDITGVYRLLGEQQAQFPGARLEAYIVTDGLNNIGVTIDHALTPEEAVALAEQISVPELSGASLTVAGLGRVTGDPVPSDVIEGLVSFYDALCERTGAAECLSVTDWR